MTTWGRNLTPKTKSELVKVLKPHWQGSKSDLWQMSLPRLKKLYRVLEYKCFMIGGQRGLSIPIILTREDAL